MDTQTSCLHQVSLNASQDQCSAGNLVRCGTSGSSFGAIGSRAVLPKNLSTGLTKPYIQILTHRQPDQIQEVAHQYLKISGGQLGWA